MSTDERIDDLEARLKTTQQALALLLTAFSKVPEAWLQENHTNTLIEAMKVDPDEALALLGGKVPPVMNWDALETFLKAASPIYTAGTLKSVHDYIQSHVAAGKESGELPYYKAAKGTGLIVWTAKDGVVSFIVKG